MALFWFVSLMFVAASEANLTTTYVAPCDNPLNPWREVILNTTYTQNPLYLDIEASSGPSKLTLELHMKYEEFKESIQVNNFTYNILQHSCCSGINSRKRSRLHLQSERNNSNEGREDSKL